MTHRVTWNPRSASAIASASRGVVPTGTITDTVPKRELVTDHLVTLVAGTSNPGRVPSLTIFEESSAAGGAALDVKAPFPGPL